MEQESETEMEKRETSRRCKVDGCLHFASFDDLCVEHADKPLLHCRQLYCTTPIWHADPMKPVLCSKHQLQEVVEGMKYDSGKPMLGLIPPEAELEEAKVLTFGAGKYAVENWRKVRPGSRYLDAALRHLNAFRAGEDIDPDSGLMHLSHARCCLGFMIALELTGVSCRVERDDDVA